MTSLLVNVTSFDSVMTYEVNASLCNAFPQYSGTRSTIPGMPWSALHLHPFATLTRFEVISSGLPVSGIDPTTISFDAEGDAATLVPGSFQEVGPGEYWAAVMPPSKAGGHDLCRLPSMSEYHHL